jgi:signal transduction histidine kinase
VAIVGALTVLLLTALVGMAFFGRYLGFSSEQALRLYLVWVPILIALALVSLIPSRRQLRTVLGWPRDVGDPVGTWYSVVRVRQMVTRGLIFGSLGIPPLASYTIIQYHKPWYGLVVMSLGPLVTALGAWTMIVFGAELILRPLLEEVAGRLPRDFQPERGGMRLRARLVMPVPIITLIAALLVGAYSNLTTNGTLRFTLALGVALGAATIGTVVYLIVARSVLAPVDDMIAATRRVREGLLDTWVPITTDGELGELTYSFNAMLNDLRFRTEELRGSRERIVAAADEERRRVERDLHDGAQQRLVLIGLKLGMLEREPARVELITEVRHELAEALEELRDLAHGIYPSLLENEGLPGALRDAAERAPIPTAFDSDGAGRYRPELEAAVYFCCLEALQNAAKHAGDDARATVRLAESDHTLRFEVADDGIGHDGPLTGTGIQNMRDRLGALGGLLTINSSPGAGTTVTGSIPVSGPSTGARASRRTP